jgi:hypothetical protein
MPRRERVHAIKRATFQPAHLRAIILWLVGTAGVLFGVFRHQQAAAVQMTASSANTPETDRGIISYEIARHKNCPKETK